MPSTPATRIAGPERRGESTTTPDRPTTDRRRYAALMDLEEVADRLQRFARVHYEDPEATVNDVQTMPGHAGFSYGFTVHSRGRSESFFLRLPPPNVRLVGTADVLRQVEVLRALDGTSVPHCSVRWAGAEEEWFGRPYFIVPLLTGGDVVRPEDPWVAALPAGVRRDMGRQAMTALAEVHRLDWSAKTPYLGDPIPFDEDVTRWDRFVEKAAEPERLALVPDVRARLLERLPDDAPVGVFHGDFQWSNLFFSYEGDLLAVIDWELTGVGATLNDVGWMATFNDPDAWESGTVSALLPQAEELVADYEAACAKPLPDIAWFRALAAYKFAIISGFNLGLHRRGKRPDPLWETTSLSMVPLLERARTLLR